MNSIAPAGGDRFPHSPGEITVQWLNSVLRDAGVLGGRGLESVDVQPTVAGFGGLGSYARLRLKHTERDLPRSLFAKFSSQTYGSRLLCEREIRFYRTIAPLITLRTPRCYFAATSDHSGCSVLLLEDLAVGRAGDSLAGCSTQQAELIFREIAAFHAQWWRKQLPPGWAWLPQHEEETGSMMEGVSRAWPAFREKYAGVIPAWAIGVVEEALRRVPEIVRAVSAGPATLTHGDVQLDNVWFDLPDAPFALGDWQFPLIAPAARDISWFLIRSLPIRQRRADEDHLIRLYHEALVEAGVGDYPLELLRHHIELGFLRGFFALIRASAGANFAGERGNRLFTARIKRSMAMLEDHEVWKRFDQADLR